MSPTLLILKNYTTFKDVQMVLKHFFDISTGFRYKKMEKSSPSIYRDVHDVLYLYVMTVCLEVQMYYVHIRLWRLKLFAFHSPYSIGIKWSGKLKSQLSAGLHNIKSVWIYALYSLWNLHICNTAQESKCQYTFAFKIAMFSNSSLWNENCV